MTKTIPAVPTTPTRFEGVDVIHRRPAVEVLTGLPRSTIYSMMAAGNFPAPVRLGVRAVGWRHSDVIAWIDSRQTRA